MNKTWIMQGNPDKFIFDEYLAMHPKIMLWTVKQHKDDIKKGDKVFIWRAIGSKRSKENRAKSGIVAETTVIESPSVMLDDAIARPYWRHISVPARPEAIKGVSCTQNLIPVAGRQ
ncbi:MAG: EVE domain-containing protein [Magnetococcales bacterium]|nr:EVE domain-containing protein [Magnetococcales bacterium]